MSIIFVVCFIFTLLNRNLIYCVLRKENESWKKNIVSLSYFAKTLCKWDFFLWRNLKLEPKLGEAQEEKSRQHSILPVTAFPSCSSTSNCSIILRFKSPWVWIDVMQRFLKRSVQQLLYQGHIYAQACEIRLAFIKLLSFSKQTTLTTLRYWRKGNVFFPNRFSP